MSSAFLLSANSRQSKASFLESICPENETAVVKDKADNCERPRRPAAAANVRRANRPSPVRELARTTPRSETPPAPARGTARETPPAPGPGAEWQQTPPAGADHRPRA